MVLDIIAFDRDRQAKDTVNWFENESKVNPRIVTFPGREHLAPLGWQNGDRELAEQVIQSIQSLRERLVKIYPDMREREAERCGLEAKPVKNQESLLEVG